MKRSISCFLTGATCLVSFLAVAQTTPPSTTATPATNVNGANQLNVINTAVPFLNFTPDARAGGMGDAGVASSPDANAIFWNPSKLVFSEKDAGVSLSYTPWLRDLIGDMYYTYLSGFKKLDKNSVIGGSLTYFDLGTIYFTTNQGIAAGQFNSREYAFTGSYSRRLGKNFSLGVNLKYLNSNLAGNTSVNGTALKPGGTAAADISFFYKKETRDDVSGRGLALAFGGMISNLGGRISYGGEQRYFIPTNLRLGTAVTYYADHLSKFNFVLDLNKLMVPTPPTYGATINGVRQITAGKDPNRNYFSAIFGSFADAPGGFNEELQEINIATGVEYWYNDLFAARAGYYNEPNMKGGRKYFTAGIGLRLQQRYGIDFSYLMPVKQGSPLANTFRLSLVVDLVKGAKPLRDDQEDEVPVEDTENKN
jgi:Type IX secretion system protein PorV